MKEGVDFVTSDRLEGDEEKVEFVKAKDVISEKSYGLNLRYFCTNCRRSIHNRPDNLKICKTNGCDCLCQWFYVGSDGYTLIRYGRNE